MLGGRYMYGNPYRALAKEGRMTEQRLDIRVRNGRFFCERQPISAERLEPPYECSFEEIELWDHGRKIDTAYIQWVGTHGACPRFTGFEKILGSEYHSEFRADQFQQYDLLRIRPAFWKDALPLDPEAYWRALVGRST